MALLSDIYIKTETLQTLLDTAKTKDLKGIAVTISTDDEANDYGQNVSAFVSQSKEEREAKKKKFYIGNGKTFWTNGEKPFVPKKEQAHTPKKEYASNNDDDLPF